MLALHVNIQIKPEYAERFIRATGDNAANSLKEPGVIRFDCIRQEDDDTRFMLVEVYRDEEALLRHKETAHYARWCSAVEEMMAVPRSRIRYTTVFPASESGWRSA